MVQQALVCWCRSVVELVNHHDVKSLGTNVVQIYLCQ